MSLDKNGWVKITGPESLPESGQKCFMWTEKTNLYPLGWCYSEYSEEDLDYIGATHWRPIFDPPVKRRK
jgi:hypothetical protein